MQSQPSSLEKWIQEHYRKLNYFCGVLYPPIFSPTMSTAIEQQESDTTLYGCIEDNVVVVSLMFFCSSFSDEQRFSLLADKSEITLRMFSFLPSNFNANGTLGRYIEQKTLCYYNYCLKHHIS